jgi:hypothetical protein
MTHLYHPMQASLLIEDIGDGVLRAGSYSSKFSIVRIRDASFSFKRILQIYSIMFVYDILCRKVSHQSYSN